MIRSARRSQVWLPTLLALLALLSACAVGSAPGSLEGTEPSPTVVKVSPKLPGGQCVPTSKMRGAKAGATPHNGARRSVQVCEATTFGGRGRVVEATALSLVDVSVVDTGPLPLAGGSLDDTLLSVDVPGVVGAGVASAATKSVGTSVQSDASIAGVSLLLGGTVVTAAVLTSEAAATCTASGATTSGSSTVTGLRIGGSTVTVTGAPNQVVVSGLVRVVLNEQVVTGGNIVVRALHASGLGSLEVADVILSEADAQVTCACQTETLDAGGDSATSDDAGGGNDSGPPGTNDSGPPGTNDSGPPGTNDSGPPGTNDSGPPSDSGPRSDGHADEDGGGDDGGRSDGGSGSDGSVLFDAGHGPDGGMSSDSGPPPHSVVDGSADADGGVRKPPHSFDAAVPPMTCDNDNPCPSSYSCVMSERLQ